MTDKEIEKALTCCKKHPDGCKKCPYQKLQKYDCYEDLLVKSKQYINRLKAKNEQVRKDTAKEIIAKLLSECDASPNDCVEPDYILRLAKQYSVEVDDE